MDVSVRCADGVPILASAITGNKTPLKRDGYFALDGNRCPRYESKCSEDEILPADFKLSVSFPTVIILVSRAVEQVVESDHTMFKRRQYIFYKAFDCQFFFVV